MRKAKEKNNKEVFSWERGKNDPKVLTDSPSISAEIDIFLLLDWFCFKSETIVTQ